MMEIIPTIGSKEKTPRKIKKTKIPVSSLLKYTSPRIELSYPKSSILKIECSSKELTEIPQIQKPLLKISSPFENNLKLKPMSQFSSAQETPIQKNPENKQEKKRSMKSYKFLRSPDLQKKNKHKKGATPNQEERKIEKFKVPRNLKGPPKKFKTFLQPKSKLSDNTDLASINPNRTPNPKRNEEDKNGSNIDGCRKEHNGIDGKEGVIIGYANNSANESDNEARRPVNTSRTPNTHQNLLWLKLHNNPNLAYFNKAYQRDKLAEYFCVVGLPKEPKLCEHTQKYKYSPCAHPFCEQMPFYSPSLIQYFPFKEYLDFPFPQQVSSNF